MIIVILVQLPFFLLSDCAPNCVFFFLNRAKYPFSILFEINDLCMDKKKKKLKIKKKFLKKLNLVSQDSAYIHRQESTA